MEIQDQEGTVKIIEERETILFIKGQNSWTCHGVNPAKPTTIDFKQWCRDMQNLPNELLLSCKP